MKKAVVTGASSGIGKAICEELQRDGYFVYDISRRSQNFACDMRKPKEIQALVTKIDQVDVLVNCAGVGRYGLHENLTPDQISDLVRTNLEGPMILTQLLLPKLKASKGVLVNVSSITADQINTHGCAYGATKAALSSFTKSLFAEVRKHGLRCVDVKPDMTDTNLYASANFTVADDPDSYLNPKDVAQTIAYCIKNPAITSITLQPQKHQIKKK